MTFKVSFIPSAAEQIRQYEKAPQQIILKAIENVLTHQPIVEAFDEQECQDQISARNWTTWNWNTTCYRFP